MVQCSAKIAAASIAFASETVRIAHVVIHLQEEGVERFADCNAKAACIISLV